MMIVESAKISTSNKLYLLIADRLEQQGETLPCTMEALSVYAMEPRADIDYLKLINLDNRSLFDACYILSFNTLPPAHYIEEWQDDIANLPKEEFHRKFINSFVRLRIFPIHHVRLRNCIYLNIPEKIQPGYEIKFRRWKWIYDLFHPLYIRFPVSFKKKLKKLLWNQFFVR